MMPDLLMLALTFFCGAIYECACVFWVYYSEKNKAGLAALWSCLAALVTVVGLGEALHRPIFIAAYVSGFGAGTWLAVKAKTRWFAM